MTSPEKPLNKKPLQPFAVDGFSIPPLDLSVKPSNCQDVQAYFDFYGINFGLHFSGVTHYFGSIPNDPFETAVHYYQCDNSVATCFIVHGYFDHSGLYKHLIEYCLNHQISVVVFDLPGHGLSGGEPASIGDFQDYQQALKNVVAFIGNETGEPRYVMAQSTGAAIVMDYLLSEKHPVFSKAVVLAPLVRPASWAFVSAMHSVASVFIKRIKREFRRNSHDNRFLKFLKHEDPLQCRFLSLRWLGAFKQWLKRFIDLTPIHYPLLVVQGKKDTTVDWRFNVAVVQEKFKGSRVVYLPNAGHQLANESEEFRQPIYSAIKAYFDV